MFSKADQEHYEHNFLKDYHYWVVSCNQFQSINRVARVAVQTARCAYNVLRIGARPAEAVPRKACALGCL